MSRRQKGCNKHTGKTLSTFSNFSLFGYFIVACMVTCTSDTSIAHSIQVSFIYVSYCREATRLIKIGRNEQKEAKKKERKTQMIHSNWATFSVSNHISKKWFQLSKSLSLHKSIVLSCSKSFFSAENSSFEHVPSS